MLEVSLPLRRLELHSSKVEARIPDGFTQRTIKPGEVDRHDTTAERMDSLAHLVEAAVS